MNANAWPAFSYLPLVVSSTKRVPEPLPEVVRSRLGITDPNAATYRGKGCKDCRHTGYRGRVGVYELLGMNEQVRTAIQERPTLERIMFFASSAMTATTPSTST